MKPVLLLIAFLLAPTLSSAQDPAMRSRAVALMERVHAVSLAPDPPNSERVDTFVVFDPRARAREGRSRAW